MRLYLKSLNSGIWDVTSKEYHLPKTLEKDQGELDKKNEKFNSRSMNALYSALDELEYNHTNALTPHMKFGNLLKLFIREHHIKRKKAHKCFC